MLFAYTRKMSRTGPGCDPDNYRSISLLNAAYKVYSKMFNERLHTVSDAILLEEQASFRKGRSCIDDVFTLKQLIREFNLKTHLAFVDYEKASDKVNRCKVFEIMLKRGYYPRHLVNIIASLDKSEGKTRV